MRTSKYVGKKFGNWKCIEISIANVQGKRSKAPGRCNYQYIFQRVTSDGKCNKLIKLNSTEAAKVYKNILTVEEILEKREKRVVVSKPSRQITYKFI